jgi:hypothetical protein
VDGLVHEHIRAHREIDILEVDRVAERERAAVDTERTGPALHEPDVVERERRSEDLLQRDALIGRQRTRLGFSAGGALHC